MAKYDKRAADPLIIGALVCGASAEQAGADKDTTAKVLELFNRLADLEMEDGPGDMARLLAGLPAAFVNELRQNLQRLTDTQSPDARSET
jgi:hypothetical protein